jgi:hypothetical protein
VHDPLPDEGLILTHDDTNPLRLAHVATLSSSAGDAVGQPPGGWTQPFA